MFPYPTRYSTIIAWQQYVLWVKTNQEFPITDLKWRLLWSSVFAYGDDTKKCLRVSYVPKKCITAFSTTVTILFMKSSKSILQNQRLLLVTTSQKGDWLLLIKRKQPNYKINTNIITIIIILMSRRSYIAELYKQLLQNQDQLFDFEEHVYPTLFVLTVSIKSTLV